MRHVGALRDAGGGPSNDRAISPEDAESAASMACADDVLITATSAAQSSLVTLMKLGAYCRAPSGSPVRREPASVCGQEEATFEMHEGGAWGL